MSLAPTVAALARTTIFGSLDEAALQRVADESVEASYRPGAVVFAQGDPGDCLYVVTSGRLKLQVRIRGLDTLMLTTLRAPDTFGELAVIDRGPRSATVVALEPSTLLAVAARPCWRSCRTARRSRTPCCGGWAPRCAG